MPAPKALGPHVVSGDRAVPYPLKSKNFGADKYQREVLGKSRYFVFLAYRFWNRSTRPAVSTNFCVPVKNGWHFEQMPMRMSLRVDRVLMMLPHAQ